MNVSSWPAYSLWKSRLGPKIPGSSDVRLLHLASKTWYFGSSQLKLFLPEVLLTVSVRVSSEGQNSITDLFHTMLPPKKMFTSAAAEAYSLAYNNGELRLLLLKSELLLACFLNLDDTDTVILIFGTRTQCSNDDSWPSDSTVGRGEK